MWLNLLSHRVPSVIASCGLLAAIKQAVYLSLALWSMAGSSAAQQDPGWRKFVHELGWQIKYPAGLMSAVSGPSGLGKTYISRDNSAKLVIFSAVRSAADYQAFQQDLLRDVQYRGAMHTQGEGWFALAGQRNSTTYFAKFVFDKKRHFARAFLLEYDQSLSSTYEPIAAQMAANFTYEGSNWESEEDRRNRARSRAQKIIDTVTGPQKTEWRQYQNTAGDWKVSYPANVLFTDTVPSTSSVRVFRSTDAQSVLTITGGPTLMHDVQDYKAQLLSHGRHEQLKRSQVGANWFLLSGNRGGNMFYEKYLFSPEMTQVQSIALEFPASHANVFSEIVKRMEAEFSTYRVLNQPTAGGQFRTSTDRINGVTVDSGGWQDNNGKGVLTLTLTNNTDGVLQSVQVDPFRSDLWKTIKLEPPIYPGESDQVELEVILASDGKPAETSHRPKDRLKWWDNNHRNVILSVFNREEEFKEEFGTWLFGN
ncbi:hypothetical protein [Parasedimentitalea psychrophila]|uniref:Uncharacterized protein n=1 Tax=Parasedimentitalea psychrophila TaxID=2997337 RepID=A0A9Y2KYH2_9RHOB|nr:hypothetical protein [Parasedimentitalea psychrophila]WIY24207.1 hypothetical protein QPJ95_16595 [Parasedimentitalea psychrophila]